jgi:3-isopropylmalate/(R)-2-methylmalate dehydratase large subunit
MGSTDVAAAMATGETWMKVPSTIKFVYHGKLNKWVTAKDLILYTIGHIGVDGATYKAMEFHGEVIDDLTMDGRFTMSNMSMEAGAKVGLCEADNKTLEYLKPLTKRPLSVLRADPDAEYEQVIEYDVSSFEPQVAFPYIPSNVKPISEAVKMKIEIHQVVIGLCVNGRISDLAVAAEILEGRKVHQSVRCIISPNSQDVYLQALQKGFIKTFIESGAAVTTPSCAACGAHQGTLASGERLVSTGNRNFVGRMGHRESEIYLVSPAVAAASAILGRIANPMEVMS